MYKFQTSEIQFRQPVTINEDGSFSIFLNARLSYEQRMQAYLHEMRHIQKDDFFTHNTVEEKELHNKH